MLVPVYGSAAAVILGIFYYFYCADRKKYGYVTLVSKNDLKGLFVKISGQAEVTKGNNSDKYVQDIELSYDENVTKQFIKTIKDT